MTRAAVARWGTPAALMVGAAALGLWLLVLARTQWFYMDEFDYFRSSPDPLIVWLLRPHNEHTVAFTKLWFDSSMPIMGLRHYVLYALPLVATHLLVVGVIYRLTWIATRARTVAAATALMTAAMGAAFTTLTWAGQFQYTGAVAAGLVVILLAFEAPTRARRLALAAAIIFGTFSGTAFVTLALAAAVAYAFRRRWLEAGIVAAVPLGWLLLVRVIWAPGNIYAAHDLGEILRLGPAFAFSVVDVAITQTLGDSHFSAALLVAMAIGILAVLRASLRSMTTGLAGQVIGTLALATILTMLALIAGRLARGSELSSGGQYSYLFLVTLFPIAGILLGQPAQSRSSVVAIVLTMAVITVMGIATISDGARSLSDWRLNGARVMQAAAAQLAQGLPTYPDQVPVPDTAPTVSQDRLRSWVASGALDPNRGPTDASDQASLNMQWRLVAGVGALGQCQSLGSGAQVSVPPAASISLADVAPGTVVSVQYPTSPALRRFGLSSPVSALQSVADRAALLSVEAGSARVCVAPLLDVRRSDVEGHAHHIRDSAAVRPRVSPRQRLDQPVSVAIAPS